MEMVSLGNSDIQITRFCLGTWNMGANKEGWGPGDEQNSIDLIHYALDNGCNFVDTARGYGDSENVVGKALKDRREKVILASKLVHCPPEKVAPGLEQSLTALDTDYIDLYICHWPSPSQDLGAFLGELEKLKQAGKIRAIGVSNFNLDQMKIAEGFGCVSLQPPLSILWRAPDEVLDFCREKKITVTPYSPMAQGLLTGKFTRGQADPGGPRKSNLLFQDPMWPKAKAVAEEVDRVADDLGCTSSQVALAWLLQMPGTIVPIAGVSKRAHWDDNAAALSVKLPEDVWKRLDEMGREVWGMVDPEDAMWGWKPK